MESSPGDEFDLASWAKSFTAAATVKMMEQCYLSKNRWPVGFIRIFFSKQQKKFIQTRNRRRWKKWINAFHKSPFGQFIEIFCSFHSTVFPEDETKRFACRHWFASVPTLRVSISRESSVACFHLLRFQEDQKRWQPVGFIDASNWPSYTMDT